MKKTVLFFTAICCSFSLVAQIPPGYYNSAQGLTGTPLRQALHDIIDNHTSISYNALWTAFQTTDKKSNGKVWDMYSDLPTGAPPYQFTFGTDQCGTYTNEGDCYNREHVWPQSAFNSASPMVSDLFHIYPTDGKVNGERSNYAYGNVGSTVYFTSLNGSKLGICNPCGSFSGVAFEPIDDYKGDIARSLFYMSTRYYTEDAAWQSAGFANKAELYPWAISILLSWHHMDPVSTKETNRNNAVYGIQNNRNPYIDHPEWADSVFASAAIGIMQNLKTNEIYAYPNPLSGNILYIKKANPEQYIEVKLLNMLGQEISIYQGTNDSVNLESITSGIYTVVIQTENGEIATHRLIITNEQQD